MKLTVTQVNLIGSSSTYRNSFITHIVYSNPLLFPFMINQKYTSNNIDYDEIQEYTHNSGTLEITFDKDYYGVEHEQSSDYYANVPSWIVRLLTSRSRNR